MSHLVVGSGSLLLQLSHCAALWAGQLGYGCVLHMVLGPCLLTISQIAPATLPAGSLFSDTTRALRAWCGINSVTDQLKSIGLDGLAMLPEY